MSYKIYIEHKTSLNSVKQVEVNRDKVTSNTFKNYTVFVLYETDVPQRISINSTESLDEWIKKWG